MRIELACTPCRLRVRRRDTHVRANLKSKYGASVIGIAANQGEFVVDNPWKYPVDNPVLGPDTGGTMIHPTNGKVTICGPVDSNDLNPVLGNIRPHFVRTRNVDEFIEIACTVPFSPCLR